VTPPAAADGKGDASDSPAAGSSPAASLRRNSRRSGPATGIVLPPGIGGRTLVTLVTAGGFAGLAWADATGAAGLRAGWWLLPVALVVTAGGVEELRRLYQSAGIRLPGALLAAGGVAMLLAAAAGPTDRPIAPLASAAMILSGLVVALCVDAVARYRPHDRALDRLAAGCLTVVFFCLPMAFLVCLRYVSRTGDPAGRHDLLPLASMVAVAKGGDIAAYLVGATIGRLPMAPTLSPRKTWEGGAASIAAGVLIAWLTVGLLAPAGTGPWGGWAAYGLLVGAGGMVGDLAESLLKRELQAKDSGHLLAALGGVLDLVDAFLVAAPVAWLLWFAGGG
jgi:phosphatidate cytidylyltransferase